MLYLEYIIIVFPICIDLVLNQSERLCKADARKLRFKATFKSLVVWKNNIESGAMKSLIYQERLW